MAKLVYKDEDEWVIVPPKNEMIWVVYHKSSKEPPVAFITSKESREYYYAYRVVGDAYKKVGRARSPVELEEKYISL